MRQAGTLTGRFSYRNPNLQNIPAEDDEEDMVRDNLIRRCFVPPAGHKLVSIDFAAQEYRIMLAYAGQWDLIAKVNAGLDLHQATADMIGITRKHAKSVAFATLYGSGPAKLAEMLGIQEYQAAELRRRYLGALPLVASLIAQIKSTSKTRGHIYNWAGRKLHLPGGLTENAYAMPNHLIQSSGADICKRAMVEIDKEFGARANMFMQVHDSLNFYIPESELDMIPRLAEIMESMWPIKNNMAMKVDVKLSGKSMAAKDMEKYARL
jgi:DNA polymerase-1